MAARRPDKPIALLMAVAKLTGTAWRTADAPRDEWYPALIEIATCAGDNAAQACADSADYFRAQLPKCPGWEERHQLLIERLDALAAEIAGHPITPSPRPRPQTMPRYEPSWRHD